MTLNEIIKTSLAEDIGPGDVTSIATIPETALYRGELLVKAPGIAAGLEVARLTFSEYDSSVSFQTLIPDGQPIKPGDILAKVSGSGRSILTSERVALNFLQRMSGIATATHAYVEAVEPHQAVILDTRKTAPGLRVLDKMAVRIGGGQNHRFGLFDMYLVKDNHIVAAGGIRNALQRVASENKNHLPVEVEVTNLPQLDEVLPFKVDRILLDNMNTTEMRLAVVRVNGRVPLEASGNINLQNVHDVAATGVDYISIGALTHSVKALDISLELTS